MGEQKIKCIIWDLDQTIWKGIISEGDHVEADSKIVEIIKELDKRGILQSISSKNNLKLVQEKLEEMGLWEYFLYPQINWNAKSHSIAEIARCINIGFDTLAFVDDQQFELDEVHFTHPDVMCINAINAYDIPDMKRFQPLYITSDSKNRRKMYQSDIYRNHIENEFEGTKEEFLKTLGMVLKIEEATTEDLQRAEELTVRTHQLNSTGYIYSYDELKKFIDSDDFEVLVVQLDDKYGEYGKIGLALIEKNAEFWEIKLLLMSCRVIAKGVGNVLLNYIINQAIDHQIDLRAQFVPTDRNRLMHVTFKMNGFKELVQNNNIIIFQCDLSKKRPMPEYIKLIC